MAYGILKADILKGTSNTINTDSLYEAAHNIPSVVNNAAFRNRLLNGGMSISQRGSSISITNGYYNYGLDRWKINTAGSATLQELSSPTIPNFAFSMSYSSTDINPGVEIGQQIEYQNFYDLVGSTVTISFYAKANNTNTGSINLTLRVRTDSNQDNSIIFTGTNYSDTQIILSTTAARYQVQYTIPLNTKSLSLEFILNNHVVGDGFEITGIQLEAGTLATDFEFRNIELEQLLCQRYYYRYNNTRQFIWLTNTSNGFTLGLVNHPVYMRTIPSMSFTTNVWNAVGFGYTPGNSFANIQTTVSPNYVTQTSWGITADTSYSSISSFVIWGGNSNVIIEASSEF